MWNGHDGESEGGSTRPSDELHCGKLICMKGSWAKTHSAVIVSNCYIALQGCFRLSLSVTLRLVEREFSREK